MHRESGSRSAATNSCDLQKQRKKRQRRRCGGPEPVRRCSGLCLGSPFGAGRHQTFTFNLQSGSKSSQLIYYPSPDSLVVGPLVKNWILGEDFQHPFHFQKAEAMQIKVYNILV